MKKRVCNLYGGLGGNRKLWTDVDVTMVEKDPEIAAIYKEIFPEDEVIVGDAHEFLLDNYFKDWWLIWTSTPCPTHSKSAMWASKGGRYKVRYPDMKLYQENILLKHFTECLWVSENVNPYYEPLMKPDAQIGRHLFWSNFKITPFREDEKVSPWSVTSNTEAYGFSVKDRDIKHRKDQLIRNLVNPEIGLHILNCANGNYKSTAKQTPLFQ
jgi:DNA (cytosine-5)-methyltransferase 1